MGQAPLSACQEMRSLRQAPLSACQEMRSLLQVPLSAFPEMRAVSKEPLSKRRETRAVFEERRWKRFFVRKPLASRRTSSLAPRRVSYERRCERFEGESVELKAPPMGEGRLSAFEGTLRALGGRLLEKLDVRELPVRRFMGPARAVFRRVMGPPLRSMKGPPAREA